MSSAGSKRWVGDKRFIHILLPEEHGEHAIFFICVPIQSLYSLLFTHKPQERREKKKKKQNKIQTR